MKNKYGAKLNAILALSYAYEENSLDKVIPKINEIKK